jgi:hypothetical protein
MPTANLFLVTQTLQRLLEFDVRALLRRQGLPTNINITAMPPERVGAAANTLNLYLYHLMEDAYYKNRPPPGRGGPPVSRQPLTLLLYYILTAHHEINDVFDAETQQLQFGLGMKAFHDHAVVDDELAISPDGGPPQIVMSAGLRGRGNRMEIALRPLTPEEALAFWSAEQPSTTRLAAYYEVRTIFLEPELPTDAFGTVFDLGLFVSAGLSPMIERVASVVQFTPPAATGLGPQTIEVAPARATLALGLVPPVNRVLVIGRALSGDGRRGAARFRLRTPAWRDLVPPVRAAAIDRTLNPGWAVALNENAGQFDFQGQLAIDDGAGGVINLEVTPGIYALSVETTRRQETPSGLLRITTPESNQIAFSVGARIDGADPPNAAGRIVLRVVNLFDMQAAGLEVQLSVDGVLYDETAAFAGNAAQDRGLFERQAGQIEFHPLFDPAVAAVHPVRLVINGAESQPFWIVTP